MSESTGARAALKAQITERIHATTGDKAVAEARANALMVQKREQTRAGVRMLGMTIALTGLSYLLHMAPLMTFGVALIGGLWSGYTVSGPYFKAAAKDLAEAILTLGGAIRKVKDGSPTPAASAHRDPEDGTEPTP